VRSLDTAFFLSARCLKKKESGVEPPHSKVSRPHRLSTRLPIFATSIAARLRIFMVATAAIG
jgi:hypothetical protein